MTREISLRCEHAQLRPLTPRFLELVLWLVCSLAAFAAATAQAAPNVHLPAPTVVKAFSPNQVSVGGTSQMTITLNNDNGVALTGVAFTDSYPVGMANASSGVIVTNTCGGTSFTADPGGQSAALVGGTIPANGNCVIVLNVVGTAAGAGTTLTNHTGSVTSTNAFGSADATADLTVTTQTLMQPPTVTMTALPASITVGGIASMLISLNNPNLFDVTGVQFAINYPTPTHIVNVSTGAILDEDVCASSSLAPGGGTSLTVTGATIPAGSSCVFILTVVGITEGDSDLHTGSVLSSNAGPGADATATLSVTSGSLLAAPRLGKTFSPNSFKVGGTSQLTFTFTNEDPNNAVTGLQQVDFYPNNITNAPNALVTNTCGGLVLLHAHDGIADDFHLFNGTIPAGGTCNVVVNVVGTNAASGHNAIINDRNGNAQTGSTASADEAVTAGSLLGAPTATKEFVPSNIAIGAPSQMTITLNNANSFAITGAQFTDNYPDGMVNASNNPVDSNDCGGTVTADPSGHSATLVNGTIPAVPLGTCKVVINVVGASAGSWVNQTGEILAANALAGASTFGALTVTATPQTIAFTSPAPANAKVGGTTYDATAQATSNLPVTLTIDAVSDTVCAINSGTVSFIGIGTCTIDANQGGDAAFAPAPQVQQSFTVAAPSGVAPQTITFTSTAPVNAQVAGPTYSAMAHATSNLGVTLTIDASSDTVCTISNGTVAFIGVGTCTIDANQGGDATYAPAPQAQQSFSVAASNGVTPQVITFTSAAPINATIGGLPYAAAAHSTSNLPVTLTIDNASDTVCAINNGTVTFIGVGTCTIDANQGGNATFAAAPQEQQSFAVTAGVGNTSQTIAFVSTAPVNAKVGDPAYVAIATATSNLPVSLTIDAASDTICAINNGIVTFIGIGTCTIDANQGGDATFAPAPQVQQSFAVSAPNGVTPQSIVFTSAAPINASVGGPDYVAIAHASSNLAVILSIDSASDTVCTINNGAVSFIGVGTCTIDANQGGNATFAPAPQVQQSFAVVFSGGVTPQTITFTSPTPGSAKVAGPVYVATAHATSNLPVILTIDATSDTVCAINGATVTFIGVGTCTIDANQGGDAMFAPAPQVQQSFAVAVSGGITPQTITFTSTAPANAKVAGPPYVATAHATSNLPVNLTIDNASDTVCAINNGIVSFIGIGTCTIDANQGGNATFAAASQVQQSFTVATAGGVTQQTIAFTSVTPSTATVGGSYVATAHASSNLPVILTIDAGSNTVCTINNGTVTFIGIGTCTIDANQGGDATFAPAPQV